MSECNHKWSEIVDLRDGSTEHYRECVECGITKPTGVHDSSNSESSTRDTTSYEFTDASVEVSSNADGVLQNLDDFSKSLELSGEK